MYSKNFNQRDIFKLIIVAIIDLIYDQDLMKPKNFEYIDTLLVKEHVV